MTRYTFEFISAYQCQSEYRIWRDGKSDTRISVKDRACFYSDLSPILKAELQAFNEWKAADHAKACAKYGAETVGEFVPYYARKES